MELKFTSYRKDDRRVLPIALGAIPAAIVREFPLVPIAVRQGTVVIAVPVIPDVEDLEVIDRLQFASNREFEFVVVTDEALQYARTRYLLGAS